MKKKLIVALREIEDLIEDLDGRFAPGRTGDSVSEIVAKLMDVQKLIISELGRNVGLKQVEKTLDNTR